uniref:Phosphorylase b kinase regulatory subunit n=1 Tax=Ascaris lumbricoides TaxID=6252 RepID=A0A0M3IAF1_ASCLU
MVPTIEASLVDECLLVCRLIVSQMESAGYAWGLAGCEYLLLILHSSYGEEGIKTMKYDCPGHEVYLVVLKILYVETTVEDMRAQFSSYFEE